MKTLCTLYHALCSHTRKYNHFTINSMLYHVIIMCSLHLFLVMCIYLHICIYIQKWSQKLDNNTMHTLPWIVFTHQENIIFLQSSTRYIMSLSCVHFTYFASNVRIFTYMHIHSKMVTKSPQQHNAHSTMDCGVLCVFMVFL